MAIVVLRRWGVPAAVLLGAATVFAQVPAQPSPSPTPTPVATGLIIGRTIDGTTGKPVGGVAVTLNSPGAPSAIPVPPAPGNPATLSAFPMRIISNASGQFVFHSLPKGGYLAATKAGYALSAFGRNAPTEPGPGSGGQTLLLGEGERRGDVAIRLWEYAGLGGRVVDEAGEPVIGIEVRVLRRATAGGRSVFTQTGNQPLTDDRGMYHAGSLPPGDYVAGIVTTQTSVPTSLQEAFTAAFKSGSSLEFQRDLDRSSGGLLSSTLSVVSSGQRVGSWLLQAPSGSDRAVPGLPVEGGRVFVYPTVFYANAIVPSKAIIVTLGSGDDRSSRLQLRPVVTQGLRHARGP
jgi:hypothetical protein